MLTRQGQHSKRTIETETFDCNSTYQIYICYSFFNLTNDPTTFSSKLLYTIATFIFLKVFLPWIMCFHFTCAYYMFTLLMLVFIEHRFPCFFNVIYAMVSQDDRYWLIVASFIKNVMVLLSLVISSGDLCRSALFWITWMVVADNFFAIYQ